jgi:predicted nucleic acid-binding protein
MPKTIVITDTSCLIALTKTGVLDVLPQMYRRIIVTSDIVEEFGEPIPQWIEVMAVPDPKYQRMLEKSLDAGEASAIALAVALEDVLLVLDDLKARKEAKRLGLKVTGTLGVLFRAKENGFILALKPCIETLLASDFRISPDIVKELLTLSKEV